MRGGFSEMFILVVHSREKKLSLVCNISFGMWHREVREKNISYVTLGGICKEC